MAKPHPIKKRNVNGTISVTHGCSSLNGKKPPTYRSWSSMRSRCLDPKHKAYKNYGGRGILICARWESFENFLADMGERPQGTTLDRFPNPNGNYEPVNCRWATKAQQCRNSRRNRNIIWRGEELGIEPCALLHRLRNWSLEKAMTTPVKKRTKASPKSLPVASPSSQAYLPGCEPDHMSNLHSP